MTIEFTRGSAQGASLVARMTDPMRLAAAFVRGMAQGLYLQLAVDLRAVRKRRRLRLQSLHLLDHCIYTELSQARREVEFTYRYNLDRS